MGSNDDYYYGQGFRYKTTGNRGRFRTVTGHHKTKKEARAVVESYKKARPSQYKVTNPRIKKIKKPKSVRKSKPVDTSGYKLGYCWDNRKDAETHAKDLRKSQYGQMKKRIYTGVKVVRKGNQYCTFTKHTKGYKSWLRTGRG